MNYQEIATRIQSSVRFVRDQTRLAVDAGYVQIEHVPSQGRRNYVNRHELAAWFAHRGYRTAAEALTGGTNRNVE